MTHSRLNQIISALIVVLLLLLVIQSFKFQQGATQTVLLGVMAGLMAAVVMQSATWSSRNSVEYKIITASSLDEGALQKLGKERWRLVCFDNSAGRYIFSR